MGCGACFLNRLWFSFIGRKKCLNNNHAHIVHRITWHLFLIINLRWTRKFNVRPRMSYHVSASMVFFAYPVFLWIGSFHPLDRPTSKLNNSTGQIGKLIKCQMSLSILDFLNWFFHSSFNVFQCWRYIGSRNFFIYTSDPWILKWQNVKKNS